MKRLMPALAAHLGTAVVLTLVMIASAKANSFRAVIAEKSSITFTVRQMGVPMEGRFKRFTASMTLDTTRLDKARGSLEIDLSSIDTGLAEADQEVQGKAWFHVAVHPKAIFVLKSISANGSGLYQATGQLTIKGQTREMNFPLRLSPQGMLTGSVAMKRSDFMIGEGVWAKFDVVANEITVQFNLAVK